MNLLTLWYYGIIFHDLLNDCLEVEVKCKINLCLNQNKKKDTKQIRKA